ncbi:uncharacterized protein [Macrobrachium rosenbergii]|uniref:uncharacterized protein n=1 Tax=Macrobrachium rosenbergii TaxID=79674 RepID=UPI0034D5725B
MLADFAECVIQIGGKPNETIQKAPYNPLKLEENPLARIIEKLSDRTYVIETPGRRKRQRKIQVNLLKPYFSETKTETMSITQTTSSKEDDDGYELGAENKMNNSSILENLEVKLKHLSVDQSSELSEIDYISLRPIMGQKYKKKTNRERDDTAIENALQDFKEKGGSVRTIAIKFGIPQSTFHDYVKRDRDKVDQESFQLPSYSVRQVLSGHMERELADYLKQCFAIFHGLSTKITRKLAYEYAIANKTPVPESWDREKSAGKDWLTGFLERQKDLSLRSPEVTSLSRMTSFNKTNPAVFQTKLEEILLRYQFSEACIYNLDETGRTTVQKLPKIIAQKGVQQVGQVTSHERDELVTMVGIVCANGNAIPPCFIFLRVRFDEARMMHGAAPSCKGLIHPSGWMTSKNFLQVLQHFVINSRCSSDHKVLLIMDNHESHLSLEAINYAREHGLVILTLPPQTSNKLQPHDRAIFGPFKTYYNQGVNARMLENLGCPITIYDLAPIMDTAWDRAATH